MKQMLASLGLVATLAATQAFAQAVVTSTIPDYPRYGTDLNPVQREELRRAARAVVGALLTGASVDVAIYGHADFDAKGRQLEIDVSQQRATAADGALKALLREEAARVALPDARLQSVRYRLQGLGTLRPVVPNPQSEDDRRANRRVEFVWTVTAAAPPTPEAVFERCKRLVAGAPQPGPSRRMTCACTKLMQVTPRVQDSHYDFRARNSIPGSAGLPSLTPEQWDVAIRSLVRHMRQDIQKSSDGFSDQDTLTNLMTLDDTIGRNINDFYSQQNAGAATGLFDLVIIGDIRGRMADPNHVYSCYAGYSRANHSQ